MPKIIIEMLEGRSLEQKRELVRRVTQDVSETARIAPEEIHIIIHENSRENVAQNGKLFCDNT